MKAHAVDRRRPTAVIKKNNNARIQRPVSPIERDIQRHRCTISISVENRHSVITEVSAPLLKILNAYCRHGVPHVEAGTAVNDIDEIIEIEGVRILMLE